MDILGQPASTFAEFTGDLFKLKELLDKTVELQGQLVRDLGEVAKHEERFTLW
jgi:hypothetical protein